MTRVAVVICTLVGIVGLGAGCGAREDTYSFVLDDERLTYLLLDLQFAEVTMTGLPETSKDSLRTRYWRELSEIYGQPPEVLREEVRQLEMDPKRHMMIVQRMSALHDSIR